MSQATIVGASVVSPNNLVDVMETDTTKTVAHPQCAARGGEAIFVDNEGETVSVGFTSCEGS